jgi:hypothetical protein
MTELLIAFVMVAIGGITSDTTNRPGDGVPLKYISSCEIDLNGDDEADIAMLVETVRGGELIILLRSGDGYETYVIYCDRESVYLSCSYGKEFVGYSDTDTTGESRKTYETPGAYLELYRPEVASRAYFWNGSGFKEVQTTD